MEPAVWIAALCAYGLFRAWYDNWRGPLRPAEIEAFMARASASPSAAHNDMDVLRRFLEDDDGREFVMLNLVKVELGEVPHPQTGEPTLGPELMSRYARLFMPALMARGGHPAIVARKIGGYVDAWRVAADPGWSIVGFMRYRSRRDLMALVVDPRFSDAHPFKIAGTAETFSFPTRSTLRLFVGPRVWVGLWIALAAAFAQIGVMAAA